MRSLVMYDFLPDPSEFPNIWGIFLFFLSVYLRGFRNSCIWRALVLKSMLSFKCIIFCFASQFFCKFVLVTSHVETAQLHGTLIAVPHEEDPPEWQTEIWTWDFETLLHHVANCRLQLSYTTSPLILIILWCRAVFHLIQWRVFLMLYQ